MTNADDITHRMVLASEIPQEHPAKREIADVLWALRASRVLS